MKDKVSSLVLIIFWFIFLKSTSSTITITNCSALMSLNGSSSSFTLMNDIDCSTINPFNPISNFSGTFFGNNNTINNVFINTYFAHAGVFGVTSGATIRDLIFVNVSIIGTSGDSGALVGLATNTTIMNCHLKTCGSSPNVIQGNKAVGGSKNFSIFNKNPNSGKKKDLWDFCVEIQA